MALWMAASFLRAPPDRELESQLRGAQDTKQAWSELHSAEVLLMPLVQLLLLSRTTAALASISLDELLGHKCFVDIDIQEPLS